jgi:acetolactate synthase-1/2/3 large subunit
MSSSNTDGANLRPRIGGHVLVDALRAHSVDVVFGVPGESYLAVIDGLYDAPEIKTVLCRQEGGAAIMAEAYGKLTGRPGIGMVTRGPGATNASPGVHIAMQDSSPMILLVGQVGREMFDREAFQEIDYRQMFGGVAKWVAQIEDASRIPEYISRAFHVAVSGRPGPVVLSLPEDMLTDVVTVADAEPYKRVEAHPGPDDMAKLRDMLANAREPLMVIGGGGWNEDACAQVQAFAEASGIPVAASFRCQDYFDNRHPNYVGHMGVGIEPKLGDRIRRSDLLLVVGARLGEMTTSGYSLLDIPRPRQGLVHVHGGAEELGQVYQGDLLINAGPRAFASALSRMEPLGPDRWRESLKQGRAEYMDSLVPQAIPGDVQMGEIASWLNETLPDDVIVCNGAGNYATWMHKYFQYRGYRSCLAPTSGSMGYGVPAAVAAKIVHPDRPVLSFNGDGCYMMHGQELATAMQHNANVVFLVINNGMFGTIRMHQEREYPGRTVFTGLSNPDFAALARAYGAHGETVESTEEFQPAFERAMNAGKPALIEIRIDPEAITPKTTLTALREAALAKAK